MFIPPLGYMLKFSGSADLHEHVHPTHYMWNMFEPKGTVAWNERTEVSHDIKTTAVLWITLQIAPTLQNELRSWRPEEPPDKQVCLRQEIQCSTARMVAGMSRQRDSRSKII